MSTKRPAPRMRHNYEVAPGIMRFSAARMYAKRGAYAKKSYPPVQKEIERKTKVVVKPIGGDKNGKERKVPIKKGVYNYFIFKLLLRIAFFTWFRCV